MMYYLQVRLRGRQVAAATVLEGLHKALANSSPKPNGNENKNSNNNAAASTTTIVALDAHAQLVIQASVNIKDLYLWFRVLGE
jgi:hypothetical protein